MNHSPPPPRPMPHPEPRTSERVPFPPPGPPQPGAHGSFSTSMPSSAELQLAVDTLRRTGELQLPVTGESMAPVLVPGDQIQVIAKDPRDIRPGDVVLFAARNDRGELAGLVVHRVLLDRNGGWIARGDGAKSVDPLWTQDSVLGVVERRIRDGEEVTISPRRQSFTARARTAGWRVKSRLWGGGIFRSWLDRRRSRRAPVPQPMNEIPFQPANPPPGWTPSAAPTQAPMPPAPPNRRHRRHAPPIGTPVETTGPNFFVEPKAEPAAAPSEPTPETPTAVVEQPAPPKPAKAETPTMDSTTPTPAQTSPTQTIEPNPSSKPSPTLPYPGSDARLRASKRVSGPTAATGTWKDPDAVGRASAAAIPAPGPAAQAQEAPYYPGQELEPIPPRRERRERRRRRNVVSRTCRAAWRAVKSPFR